MSTQDHVPASTADPDPAEIAVVRPVDGRTLRKSCDRCHQQKLRCVRDKSSLTRCKRCQRAGLACVYGARSSKKAASCSVDNFALWDDWTENPAISTLADPMVDLDPTFGFELTNFDDVFTLPSPSRPATGDGVSLAGISSPRAGDEPSVGPVSLSAELTKAFHDLEATFLKIVEDQTGRSNQDYPIGETLGALDAFLGVLKLTDVTGADRPSTPQSPHDVHLRSKQASVAAQGYVLCVRLLASLSERMLQRLLASPSPAALDEAGNVQDAGLGVAGSHFSDASLVPPGLRLGDLHVPPYNFGNALTASVDILHIGGSRLDEMEHLLGISSPKRSNSTSALTEMDLAQEAPPATHSRRPSLSARFVASMLEDEASINSKSSVACLQRCRAAILGLTEHYAYCVV